MIILFPYYCTGGITNISELMNTKKSASFPTFHLFFLKRSKYTSIGILGSAGFPKNIMIEPLFFEIMAGAAFPGSPEKPGLVIQSNVHQMLFGIELLVNMATYTISIDDFVVF